MTVAVDGQTVGEKKLPAGTGDVSVFGHPEAGRRCSFAIRFSAKLLHKGINDVSITTRSGSWMLYDSLALSVAGDASLGLQRIRWPLSIPPTT